MMRGPSLALAALLLAGCMTSADQSGPPLEEAAEESHPTTDSPPVHESYPLTAGIDRTWSLVIADPAVPSSLAKFELRAAESVPAGGPVGNDDVCLEYRFSGAGGAESTSRFGSCGQANLVLSPDLQAVTLFERSGTELQPGSHVFHVRGGPQLGTLVVDLQPR